MQAHIGVNMHERGAASALPKRRAAGLALRCATWSVIVVAALLSLSTPGQALRPSSIT